MRKVKGGKWSREVERLRADLFILERAPAVLSGWQPEELGEVARWRHADLMGTPKELN